MVSKPDLIRICNLCHTSICLDLSLFMFVHLLNMSIFVTLVENIGTLQVGKVPLNGETNRPENNSSKMFEIIIG